MAKARSFDAELEALSAVGELPREQALPAIRAALGRSNNLLVSRAARYAARLELRELIPELAAALSRQLQAEDPAKADPQCWAKNELAKALSQFEHQDSGLFLAGLRLHQMEPTWGGSTDTAGALRGQCALALVQCRDMTAAAICRALLPLFRDEDPPVRVNAARALTQLGSDTAALLLRFRVELGSDAPELLGACLSGVLALEGESALAWVAGFLDHGDDLSAEAAFALAENRSPAALALLQQAHAAPFCRPSLRHTLLEAIATMRTPEARQWLLDRIASGGLQAREAADALWSAEPDVELAAQLRDLGYSRQV